MRHTIDPLGELNFDGFQEILNFTATGSESSVSVPVDGDTDKEYIIEIRNTNATYGVQILLNNDATASHYGYQNIFNNGGSISAARNADFVGIFTGWATGLAVVHLKTPTGFLKTASQEMLRHTSGTTIDRYAVFGTVYYSTANITSINFNHTSGNFTAGTTIKAYARRSA